MKKSYPLLEVETEDHIATVTMDDPASLNAVGRTMRASLALAHEDLAKDDDVRVVILTGAGRAWCSGGNAKEMEPIEGRGRRERIEQAGGAAGAFAYKLDKPVIAAINGPCLGGGLSLALSTDIRIASEKAKFGVAFVLRGLIPDWGATYMLPRIVGMEKAMELMLTGDMFDAKEAERLGVISRVVPHEDLMAETRALATKIVQRPPVAVSLIKRITWKSWLDGFDRHWDLETWGQKVCLETEDHKASVRAFLEKKPPPEYKGK
jgi:enoyl-CoA hydratase/carnithine racemase